MHRIREILKREELTQAALARRLNDTPSNVSRKINNVRGMTLDDLVDYARAIGVPAYELVAGSENAHLLNRQEAALLKAFRAMDRPGQLAMLAEFTNAALSDEQTRPAPDTEFPSPPPKH